MKLRYVLIVLGGLLSFGCSTSNKTIKDQSVSAEASPKKDYKGQRQLLDYLRSTPGVEVRGAGASLLVLVRGAKSMTGNNNPLYVVDGVNMGYDYYAAASAANPFMIERVEVLPPPRSAKYGSQGQNGVIVVTTKNSN
ncbi:MAG: TonB-dependent receptor plug domain-containing protein [Saprospiraceae bacterium]|nr:TonB-dependent receptor plug domain-containing protein [Saprospiraceae bacterium]